MASETVKFHKWFRLTKWVGSPNYVKKHLIDYADATSSDCVKIVQVKRRFAIYCRNTSANEKAK